MGTELKAIDRTNRSRSRLEAALQIYREAILPEAQNPERQILHWIDHCREDLADEFRCFALLRRNIPSAIDRGYHDGVFHRAQHVGESAVGCAVAVKCRTRHRPHWVTKKQCGSVELVVGTVKKPMAAIASS